MPIREARLCKVLLAGALALLPAGEVGATSTVLVIAQSGAVNPTSAGWTVGGPGSGVTVSGIPNDQGYAVWEIADASPTASVQYSKVIPYEWVDEAVAKGWTLRARLRVLPQSTALDPASGTVGIVVGDPWLGGNRLKLWFGAESLATGGDLRILAPGSGVEVVIAGGSVHHLVEMTQDPSQPSFDVLVDGVERISDVPGYLWQLWPEESAVQFGSVDFSGMGVAQVRFERVEFHVHIRDCTDGLDNDGDGFSDLDDPGCAHPEDPSESDTFQCNDDADNDGDGLLDLADPGCSGPGDDVEYQFPAGSTPFDVEVSLRVDWGTIPPFELGATGVSPVATVGGAVDYVRVPGLAGIDWRPGIGEPFTGYELHAAIPAATLAAGLQATNRLPIQGFLRYGSGSGSFDLPLSTSISGAGFGVGGDWALCTICSVNVFFTAAPWKLGVASAQTWNGPFPGTTHTETRHGFAHGPLSATSTAAQTSGVVQLVTPMQVEWVRAPDMGKEAVFGALRIRFIPEPGSATVLASGALLLLWLGRRRPRGADERRGAASDRN